MVDRDHDAAASKSNQADLIVFERSEESASKNRGLE